MADVTYQLTYTPRRGCPTCLGRFPLNSGGASCPDCQKAELDRAEMKRAVREVLAEEGLIPSDHDSDNSG